MSQITTRKTRRVSVAEAIDKGWIPECDRRQRKRPVDRESSEQALLIDAFRLRYRELGELLIHIPNGGSRKSKFEGYRLKKQGTRRGVSDLFWPLARGGFWGCWVEFKAAPPFDAAVTDDQREWLRLMQQQGYFACVARGVDEALVILESYLALTPTPMILSENALALLRHYAA